MSEAVIVSAVRSPIGRASKGSLVTLRPDDLATQTVRAALNRVPELDPLELDDLFLGCGQPAGEAGKNLARVVAWPSRCGPTPGRWRKSQHRC